MIEHSPDAVHTCTALWNARKAPDAPQQPYAYGAGGAGLRHSPHPSPSPHPIDIHTDPQIISFSAAYLAAFCFALLYDPD